MRIASSFVLFATTAASVFTFAAARTPAQTAKSGAQSLVFFGTYTGPVSKGIYVSRFDSGTGKLEPPQLAGEIARPSWITISPNRRYLYAISETGYSAGGEGTMTSFAIDAATGKLSMLNSVPTGGGGPCHIAIDRVGQRIFVANYGSGSVAGFRLESNGRIGQRTAFVQHHGASVNQKRQRGPHAHAVVLSADDRFLFVPDLGTDEVVSYKVSSSGELAPNDPPSVKVKPGSGPRHFVLHGGAQFGYGLNEMGSSVTAFAFDAGKGVLREIQTVSTLPQEFSGENNSAEIALDGSGRFLYASNRGHNSITVFAVDRNKGTLTEVQRESTQGKTPRNFSIDPSGKFLLAANQDSNNVVVYRVDGKTGTLTPTGQIVEVASPVCIQFLPAAKAK